MSQLMIRTGVDNIALDEENTDEDDDLMTM